MTSVIESIMYFRPVDLFCFGKNYLFSRLRFVEYILEP